MAHPKSRPGVTFSSLTSRILEQLALIAHHHLQTPWFTTACADLAMVLPIVRLIPTMVASSPYLSSSSLWSEDDEWLSFLAFALPNNMSGHRYRPVEPAGHSTHRKCVRSHVARIVHNLRRELSRKWWSVVYREVVEAATLSSTSKCVTVAARLQQPGPPLHIALEYIALPSHRSALSSLLCGDWFLAGSPCQELFCQEPGAAIASSD